MKTKSKISTLFMLVFSIFFLTGCSVDDLKSTKYVEIKGDSYSQVNKKDSNFNEIIEHGEIEIEKIETQTTTQNTLTQIDGQRGTVFFCYPNGWYESTNSKKKELTAQGNIDIDLKSTWLNKTFCDANGVLKMYVYVIPTEDFKTNLLDAVTLSNGADKKVREKMGSYPKTSDVMYDATDNFQYSYQTYSGVVKAKSGLEKNVSYTRACAFYDNQTIIVSLYLTQNSTEDIVNTMIKDVFNSISQNNTFNILTEETN